MGLLKHLEFLGQGKREKEAMYRRSSKNVLKDPLESLAEY